jgi:hypothetical protein
VLAPVTENIIGKKRLRKNDDDDDDEDDDDDDEDGSFARSPCTLAKNICRHNMTPDTRYSWFGASSCIEDAGGA